MSTEGMIVVAGEDSSNYGDKQLTKFRQESTGFVFQSVNLIPFLNAKENLTVVHELGKRTGKVAQQRAHHRRSPRRLMAEAMVER